MPEKLSQARVRDAQPPAKGQSFLWDAEVSGLALRVTAAGSKAFVLDYRSSAGLQRRMTIGRPPEWTVQAARQRAKEIRKAVTHGDDPLGERQAVRHAPTVADAWAEYERHHLPKLAARNAADQRAMWKYDIKPRLGSMKLHEVSHRNVRDLHAAITADGRATRANRVHEVVRRLFNLSRRWGWHASDNPADGVERNAEQPRERYLSPAEAQALVQALQRRADPHTGPGRAALAIALLLATGARRSEVLGARWDQFDLVEGIWTKPAATTKQRRSHRVPLGRAALAILVRMQEAALPGPWVFPGGGEAGHITDVKRTFQAVTREAGLEGVRLHDMRHAFASFAISNGASLAVVGKLLGHTQAQTTQRYAHLLDDPLRAAADQASPAGLGDR